MREYIIAWLDWRVGPGGWHPDPEYRKISILADSYCE